MRDQQVLQGLSLFEEHLRRLLRLDGERSAEDAEGESYGQGKCLVDHPASCRPDFLLIA